MVRTVSVTPKITGGKGPMKSGVNRTHTNQHAHSRWDANVELGIGWTLDTRLNVDREVRREGARWGTPRKHALFGSVGPDNMSSGSDVAEAQQRWPPDGDYPTVFEAIV